MDPEMDHARLISVDPGKKGPSRVPSWPKLRWKFTRTCQCTPISRVIWHIDVYMMFSRGKILLEIHDAIAMRTQTWVGKKCDAFTRANSVRNSRCHCYDDTNLGGKNSRCFHEAKFCKKFTMPLLWWHKHGWEKFTMILRGISRDLSLFAGVKSDIKWGT